MTIARAPGEITGYALKDIYIAKPKKDADRWAVKTLKNGEYFGDTVSVTTGYRDKDYNLFSYINDTLRINRSQLTWLNDSTAIFIKPKK